MIAAQKELAATRRQDEARDHAQHRARRNPQGSQGAGRRPHRAALLTPGKLAREAAVKAIHGRNRREAGREVRRGEGDRVRAQGRLLLHPEGSRPRPDPEPAASASTAATSTTVRPIYQRSRHPAARARLGAVPARRNAGGHARAPSAPAKTPRNSIPTPAAQTEKKFILHYNFPNFSVGETGRISGPGRREIGHGALAERSLEPMVPLDDVSLRHPRHQRDHGVQRLHLDGHRFAAAAWR